MLSHENYKLILEAPFMNLFIITFSPVTTFQIFVYGWKQFNSRHTYTQSIFNLFRIYIARVVKLK